MRMIDGIVFEQGYQQGGIEMKFLYLCNVAIMALKLEFLDGENKSVYSLDKDTTKDLLEQSLLKRDSINLLSKPISNINSIKIIEAESGIVLKLYSGKINFHLCNLCD